MTKIMIKKECWWCKGKGHTMGCDCNSCGRDGAWECVRGYCGGKPIKMQCSRCKGSGYVPAEAELYKE